MSKTVCTLSESMRGIDNVKKQFQIFLISLKEAIHMYVPEAKFSKQTFNKPWVSTGTKVLNCKLALGNRYILTGLDEHYNDYRRVNNRLINITRSAPITYEKEIL